MKEMKQRRKKERTWAEAARLVRPGGRPGRRRGGSAVPQGLPAASGPSPSNGAGGAAITLEGVKAGAGPAWRARAVLPLPRPVPRIPAVLPPAAVAGLSRAVVFLPQPGAKELRPGAVRARPPALGGPRRGSRGLRRAGLQRLPARDAGGAAGRFRACRAGLWARSRSFSSFQMVLNLPGRNRSLRRGHGRCQKFVV